MVALVQRACAAQLAVWLAGCTSFGTAAPGAGAGSVDAGRAEPSDAGDASTPSTPRRVGFRPSYSEGSTVSVLVPADVAVGDVLVAFACAAGSGSADLRLPDDWTPLGHADAHADAKSSTSPSGLWAGYHTVQTGESDLTTYPFSAKYFADHISVFVTAFRGARPSQPITPVVVQPTAGTPGPPAAFDVPTFTTQGRSAALFCVCSFGDQSLPEVQDFDRLQSSSGFALYASKGLLSDGAIATAPHIELPGIASATSPVVATASLAIVAQP